MNTAPAYLAKESYPTNFPITRKKNAHTSKFGGNDVLSRMSATSAKPSGDRRQLGSRRTTGNRTSEMHREAQHLGGPNPDESSVRYDVGNGKPDVDGVRRKSTSDTSRYQSNRRRRRSKISLKISHVETRL